MFILYSGFPSDEQQQQSNGSGGVFIQRQLSRDGRLSSSNSLAMQPYGPYSRPPAPLPTDSALMDTNNGGGGAQATSSWQSSWNHSTTNAAAAAAAVDEDESHYASQLRSSMAALLQGHIRQSSTASNSSSTFSSYSDEFHHQQPPPTLLGIPDVNGSGGFSPSSPPPPPPPVRDASSLKYVKYGPGHEKHPSWPIPASQGGGGGGGQGQSQRSKSWTDHTDYPKEPPASYTRPPPNPGGSTTIGGDRRSSYNQQLKTVMENCERIPAEIYQATSVSVDPGNYLPTYDCDGRNIDDKDYSIPSPPERDVSGPIRSAVSGGGQGGSGSGSADSGTSDYAKYEDIQQYSHSEGYSSYVPSESSYVSVSGTPLLDQLRRDNCDGLEQGPKEPGPRDSVSTVVTHSSSSNSSNDTLRWHGSYNDITVTGATAAVDSTASALVVHSAKVQAPQRHNSESVLYYEHPAPAASTAMKTINRQGGWSQRVERKNQWNSNQLSATSTADHGHQEASARTSPSSPSGGEPAPLSVAERIHQLEWQSRSVPNLSRSGNDSTSSSPQRRSSAQPLALANGGHTISLDPVTSSSPERVTPEATVDSAAVAGSIQQQQQKYTFLDPDKRMRVADPTLKAIQKQALLSYYERHAGRSSMASKSPPPPALPRTCSSSSSNGANNNSHPLKVS